MIQLGSLFYRGDLKHVLVFALLESVMCYFSTTQRVQRHKNSKQKSASKDIELTP